MPDPQYPLQFPVRSRAGQIALWALSAAVPYAEAARRHDVRPDAVQRAARMLALSHIDKAPPALGLPFLAAAPLHVFRCAWSECVRGRALRNQADAEAATGSKLRGWAEILAWRVRPFVWQVPPGREDPRGEPPAAEPEVPPDPPRKWTATPHWSAPDYAAACRFLAQALRARIDSDPAAATRRTVLLRSPRDGEFRAAATALRARIDSDPVAYAMTYLIDKSKHHAGAPARDYRDESLAVRARQPATSARQPATSARTDSSTRAYGQSTRAYGQSTRAYGQSSNGGISGYHRQRADTLLHLGNDPDRTLDGIAAGPHAPFLAQAIDELVAEIENGKIVTSVRRWAKRTLVKRCATLALRADRDRSEADAAARGQPRRAAFRRWLEERRVTAPRAMIEARNTPPDLRSSFIPWYEAVTQDGSGSPARLLMELAGWRELARSGAPLPAPPSARIPARMPVQALAAAEEAEIRRGYDLIATQNLMRELENETSRPRQEELEDRIDPDLRAEVEAAQRQAAACRAERRRGGSGRPAEDVQSQADSEAAPEQLAQWIAFLEGRAPNPYPPAPPSTAELDARRAYRQEKFPQYLERVRSEPLRPNSFAHYARRQGVSDAEL